MAIKGKIELCSSLRSKICDEQGIGNYPLWMRYDSFEALISRCVKDEYKSFFAHPQLYRTNDDEFIVWHTEPSSNGDTPIRLTQLIGEEKERYEKIKNETLNYYRDLISSTQSKDVVEYFTKALKNVDDFNDFFYCFDNKVVVVLWGMRPKNIKDLSNVVIENTLVPNVSYSVTFDLASHGISDGQLVIYKRPTDMPIQANQIPSVKPKGGYLFRGWDKNPLNFKVKENVVFTAQYDLLEIEPPTVDPIVVILPKPEPKPVEPIKHKVCFVDNNGNIIKECWVKDGEILNLTGIPKLIDTDKLLFQGWKGGVDKPIYSNSTFNPIYSERPLSWWERFRLWWSGNGCLKWLLRLLLFLLFLLFLLWLLNKCSHNHSAYTGQNPFLPPGGDELYQPINPEEPGFEFLPEEPNKPIPIDDGDVIDDEEGNRKIVANRLNVLLDDDNLTINQFAQNFKQIYEGDQYQIVYADPIIKRLQIEIPAEERVKIKNELVQRLSEQSEQYTSENVFVWDEALMVGQYVPNDSRIGECWYHNTIKTYSAWDITMGNEDIIVAIIDDGCNLRHEEFQNKIVKPYNVFTKSSNVESSDVDHGTHVAGLAVAVANNQKGIAGVAPNCKLMPIQVFDNEGYCSVISVLDGVLYAVYNGADVINLSLGMMFADNLPTAVQRELINNYFKEEERVWKKVFSIANRNNTAIVLAAGNENLMAGIEPMHRSQDVIVVAAVDVNNNPLYSKANFSNYGPYTDVSAPGVEILSSIGKNKYQSVSGTSMAAPIVAGAVALIKSVNRPLSTEQIRNILQETGIEVNGNIGKLIQLDRALAKAKNADINIIEENPEPSTGSVQVLLKWHNYNDLDLICRDPNGDVVWYKNKIVPSGGMLEIDMNAGNRYSASPIENIYWPQDGAPKGNYVVEVLYYNRHDTQESSSDFEIIVRYGDCERSYKGRAQAKGDKLKVCEFTF